MQLLVDLVDRGQTLGGATDILGYDLQVRVGESIRGNNVVGCGDNVW